MCDPPQMASTIKSKQRNTRNTVQHTHPPSKQQPSSDMLRSGKLRLAGRFFPLSLFDRQGAPPSSSTASPRVVSDSSVSSGETSTSSTLSDPASSSQQAVASCGFPRTTWDDDDYPFLPMDDSPDLAGRLLWAARNASCALSTSLRERTPVDACMFYLSCFDRVFELCVLSLSSHAQLTAGIEPSGTTASTAVMRSCLSGSSTYKI